MSAKRAKIYLNRYHKLRRTAESLERRVMELEVKAQGVGAIRYDKDRVQTSPENRIEEDAIRLAEIREEYRKAVLRYAEAALTIEQQVESIEPELLHLILRMRYIETDPGGYQMSLRRISWKLKRSYNYICNQHGAALEAFDKKFLSSVN